MESISRAKTLDQAREDYWRALEQLVEFGTQEGSHSEISRMRERLDSFESDINWISRLEVSNEEFLEFVNKTDVKHLVEVGGSRARHLQQFWDHPEWVDKDVKLKTMRDVECVKHVGCQTILKICRYLSSQKKTAEHSKEGAKT